MNNMLSKNPGTPGLYHPYDDILLLPGSTGTLCIPFNSIIRVEASSNYSKVFCKGHSFPIVAAKVLRWFEERLPQPVFTRVHRTHLVNRAYMKAIKDNTVVLESGMQIGISRRKRKNCLAIFYNGTL